MSQLRPSQRDDRDLLALEARACWLLAHAADPTERARLCFPQAWPSEAGEGSEWNQEPVVLDAGEKEQAMGCPDDAVVLQNALVDMLKSPSAVAPRSRLGVALRLAAMRLEEASLHTLAEFAHHANRPPLQNRIPKTFRSRRGEHETQSTTGPFSQHGTDTRRYRKEWNSDVMRPEVEDSDHTGRALNADRKLVSGFQNHAGRHNKGISSACSTGESVCEWLSVLPLLGRMDPTSPHVLSPSSSINSLVSHKQNQYHLDQLTASLSALDARAALSASRFALDAKLAASPHAPWTLAAVHAHLLHPPLPFPSFLNRNEWPVDVEAVWQGCMLHEEDSNNKNMIALIHEAASSCHRRRDASLLQRSTRGYLLPTPTQEMLQALRLRDASNGFKVAAFVARNASCLPPSSGTLQEGLVGGQEDVTAKWMVEKQAWDACGRPFLSRLAWLHAVDARERCSSPDASDLMASGVGTGNAGNGEWLTRLSKSKSQMVNVDRRKVWHNLRMEEASAYVQGHFDEVERRRSMEEQLANKLGKQWRNVWAKVALQDRLQGRGGTAWASTFGAMAHHARVADPNGRAEDAVRWMRTCEPHWKRDHGQADPRLDSWMAAAMASTPSMLQHNSLEAEKRAQMAADKLVTCGDLPGAREALYVLAALRHARGDLHGRDEVAARFIDVDSQCQAQ